MMISKKMRNNKGVTLLELLVTLVIISGILTGILSFYNSSLKSNLRAQVRSELKFLAEEELERLLSLSYDADELNVFGSLVGRTNFFEDEAYIIKTVVIFIDPETGDVPEEYPLDETTDTKLKKITVSVARKDGLAGQVNMINFKTP